MLRIKQTSADDSYPEGNSSGHFFENNPIDFCVIGERGSSRGDAVGLDHLDYAEPLGRPLKGEGK